MAGQAKMEGLCTWVRTQTALRTPTLRHRHTGAGMTLTDTWLKANNGKERAALEERSDRDGLGVRITPTGAIP